MTNSRTHIVRFTNERGEKVEIQTERASDERVFVSLFGGRSAMPGKLELTMAEATQLGHLLVALGKPLSKCELDNKT